MVCCEQPRLYRHRRGGREKQNNKIAVRRKILFQLPKFGVRGYKRIAGKIKLEK